MTGDSGLKLLDAGVLIRDCSLLENLKQALKQISFRACFISTYSE